MQPIPACTICGAPELDRWCADCRERMEAAYADAEAERVYAHLETLPTVVVEPDLF